MGGQKGGWCGREGEGQSFKDGCDVVTELSNTSLLPVWSRFTASRRESGQSVALWTIRGR